MKHITHLLGICILPGLLAAAGNDTTAALASYIRSLRIIDVHEHLYTEDEYQSNPADNLFALFYPNAYDDLRSAGMPDSDWRLIINPAFPLADRWALFAPYWQRMRNTGFGRIPLIIARDLYGIDDINDGTYAELNRRMAAARDPKWYRRVLKEKAGIDLIVEDQGNREFDRTLFRHVVKFDHLVAVFSGTQVEAMGRLYRQPVSGLNDYLTIIDKAVADGMHHGMIGIKIALAYERSLQIDRVGREEAEKIFAQLLLQPNGSPDLPLEAIKRLQDYLIFHLCRLAAEHELPVQIHTGLQAWLKNDIRQADPAGLIPLFQTFPSVRFSLLHGSYPYGAHLAVLAKQYPNVYFDLSWLYAISPSYAERYLHEWIETVPGNKIMAFGGDYFYPEQSYAETVIAREVVTRVLSEKLESGYLTLESAKFLAAALLRDNGLNYFRIKGYTPAVSPVSRPIDNPVIKELVKERDLNAGLVSRWLAAGPFDLKADGINQSRPPAGFLQPLPPEASVDPGAVMHHEGRIYSWIQVLADSAGYLDFAGTFGNYRMSIGFAYTEISSRDSRQVVMTVGSCDGLKIWVNGVLVHDRHGLHKAARDDTIISVPFRSGTNHILFKVEHFLGTDWGLYLRVLDPDKALTFKKKFTGFKAGV